MTLASSNPPIPAALSLHRVPARARGRQRPRITLPAIRGAIQWQPRYQPRDAAEFCGLSEDRVTDSILERPELFPERKRFARRHDWNEDEFVRVVASVCSLCPKARHFVESKLSALSTK